MDVVNETVNECEIRTSAKSVSFIIHPATFFNEYFQEVVGGGEFTQSLRVLSLDQNKKWFP